MLYFRISYICLLLSYIGGMLRCEHMGSASKTNFSSFGYRRNRNGIGFYFQLTILVRGLSFEAFFECNSELEHLVWSTFGCCAQSFLHRLVVQTQSEDVIDQIVNLPFEIALRGEAIERIPEPLKGPFVFLITGRNEFHPEFYFVSQMFVFTDPEEQEG